jgi:hypothetical protein
MYRHTPTRLYWGRRDNRWDVYPQEPAQLVAHNPEGSWLPMPDGRWYKSPVSFVLLEEVNTPELCDGEWVRVEVTARAKLSEFRRVAA